VRFLDHQKATGAPLDFFSWHIYTADVKELTDKAVRIRRYLDERGFTKSESILNEWNYNRSFSEGFAASTRWRKGGKGAAFAAAVMSACQDKPVDMLMYYDARPVSWNGIFDGSTPLKTYWTFWAWKELVRRGTEVRTSSAEADVYVVAAKDAKGRFGVLVTRYKDDENDFTDRVVDVRLQGGVWSEARAYMTDEQMMNGSPCPFAVTDNVMHLTMPPRSLVFIENR